MKKTEITARFNAAEMTEAERNTIYTAVEEKLHYEMLRECDGDWVELLLVRGHEFKERLVMLLAFEGVKARIQSGMVFLA